MSSLLLAGLVAAAVLGPVGCGASALAEDACMVTDDCANFNEREMEECIARNDGELDRAAIYGCEEELTEALECYIEDDECEDPLDCADEYADYLECVDDASSDQVEIET